MQSQEGWRKGSCPHDSRSVNSPSLHPGQVDDVFPGGKSYALGPRFHIQGLSSLKDTGHSVHRLSNQAFVIAKSWKQPTDQCRWSSHSSQ